MRKRSSTDLRMMAVVGLLSTLAGCGGGEPFEMASVSGKVLYRGGTPLGPAEVASIQFVPDGIPAVRNFVPPVASGVIQPDGTFSLRSGRLDGAIVGKYKVRMQ